MSGVPVNEIICGDCLEVMRGWPDGCIHCIVTSPPYWGLRNYGVDGQLGLEKTPEEYVAHLLGVGRQMRRVLRDDGTLWLNMGDSYAGSGQGWSKGIQYAGPKQATNRGSLTYSPDNIYSKPPNYISGKQDNGLKPKDLVGIPWLAARAFQADGWWLRSAIVWAKPNPMPESVTDRPTSSYELIFLLTKSGAPTYWTHRDRPGVREAPAPDYRWQRFDGVELDAEPDEEGWRILQVVCPVCGGKKKRVIRHVEEVMGQMCDLGTELVECDNCIEIDEDGETRVTGKIKKWAQINLWQGHDYFYDAEAVKEPGSSGPSDIRKMVEQRDRIGGKHKDLIDPLSKASAATNIGRKRAVGDPAGRNLRNVWTIATRPFRGAHFAVFPPELPKRCILAGTSAKGVCPECGAPRVRVVERGLTAHDGETASTYPGGTSAGRLALLRQAARERGAEYSSGRATLGWRPTCGCGREDVVAPLVVDPFSGSGTTCVVAKRLGCSYIGIDANEKYCRMARKRLAQTEANLFGSVPTYREKG